MTDIQHEEVVPLISSGATTSCDETFSSELESRTEPTFITKEPNGSYLAYVIPMAMGLLLVAMDGGIVVASYASIASELNQLQSASWIPTSYMLTRISFQPLSAKLSDTFGRKSCLLVCYAIYTFGSMWFGLSTSMTQLILARAIVGVGAGGISILATIIISDNVPLRVQGTWQAVSNIVLAIGAIIGAPLGGFFVDIIGWRWAFLMQVPLCIIAFFTALLTLHLPGTKSSALPKHIKRIDFGGAITLFLAVSFLLVGLDHGGNISWSDWLTIGSLIASIIFTALFILTEAFVALEPFAPIRIVCNPSLVPCYIAGFFQVSMAATQVFYIPLFYQAVEGKTASQASVWLVVGVFALLAGSLGSGFIMQRTGQYYALLVSSYFLALVGTVVVFLFSGIISVSAIGVGIGVGIGIVVTDIGKGSGITTTLIALTAHAGKVDQATAIAVSSLFQSLGAVLGLSIGGMLIQNNLRYLLRKRLPGEDVQEIVRHVRQSLSYLNQLDPATKAIVVQSYQNAIQVIFLFTIAIAALAALPSLFIKEKALSGMVHRGSRRDK